MKTTTLVIEDEEGLRSSLEKTLRRRGHDVVAAATADAARTIISARRLDLVLMDMRLPDGTGLDLLAAVREADEETVVIMMTAYPEIQTAVRAMREGARDVVVKPFDLEGLHLAIGRAMEARSLRRQVRRLEREHLHSDSEEAIVGNSPVMVRMREQIEKVAPADTPVLAVGETGTGKELVAGAIHRASPRSSGPLVKVNCSAFSEALLESELFGHEKGAYTDAREARAGLFEMADGGTLFLDEIGEMKLALQSKLLRIVEGQPFRRVGGQREVTVDVRVVAATNMDLEEAVRRGTFRQDLYFRLNAFPIVVPSLRTRGSDVLLLAQHFLDRFTVMLRKRGLRISQEAELILADYSWPGNVRELRNVMERAAILCEGTEVAAEHVPHQILASAFVARETRNALGNMPALAQIERRYIDLVIQRVGGNLSEASRILGISRNTLKAKLLHSELV